MKLSQKQLRNLIENTLKEADWFGTGDDFEEMRSAAHDEKVAGQNKKQPALKPTTGTRSLEDLDSEDLEEGSKEDDEIDADNEQGDLLDSSSIVTDACDFLSEALLQHLLEGGADDLASNAFVMMQGTIGDDKIEGPAREEDVDRFAARVADEVMDNPDLKDAIFKAAHTLLMNMMYTANEP